MVIKYKVEKSFIDKNTKEKLEQLSLGEFDEKISNDAISLLKLIESK